MTRNDIDDLLAEMDKASAKNLCFRLSIALVPVVLAVAILAIPIVDKLERQPSDAQAREQYWRDYWKGDSYEGGNKGGYDHGLVVLALLGVAIAIVFYPASGRLRYKGPIPPLPRQLPREARCKEREARSKEPQEPSSKFQFRLRHLLLVMFLVAVS